MNSKYLGVLLRFRRTFAEVIISEASPHNFHPNFKFSEFEIGHLDMFPHWLQKLMSVAHGNRYIKVTFKTKRGIQGACYFLEGLLVLSVHNLWMKIGIKGIILRTYISMFAHMNVCKLTWASFSWISVSGMSCNSSRSSLVGLGNYGEVIYHQATPETFLKLDPWPHKTVSPINQTRSFQLTSNVHLENALIALLKRWDHRIFIRWKTSLASSATISACSFRIVPMSAAPVPSFGLTKKN